jgi:hypothetical protein
MLVLSYEFEWLFLELVRQLNRIGRILYQEVKVREHKVKIQIIKLEFKHSTSLSTKNSLE